MSQVSVKSLSGKLALIVDDEADLREIVTFALKREGMTSLQAGNAQEAIGLIRQQRPDIIISDIRMPGGDGYELLRTLNEEKVRIPVIIITGSESHAETALNLLGVNVVLPKPFSSQDIVAAVRACFGLT